jgi:hypothetical protein
MAFIPVRVEWRRGNNGDEGTYVFSPKPDIRRASPGKRTAVITVPLMDGVVVQNLAQAERAIELVGVLYNKTNSWDDMETSRQNLINGIGTGPGQLHLISYQRHVYYKGQITTEGIQFETQSRSNLQDYKISLQIADSREYNYIVTSKTILSNTEIA